MTDLPDCPMGRDDCLFEQGNYSTSHKSGRRLVDRAGNVTIIPAENRISTSVRCETCGKSFMGEAESGEPIKWREAEGFVRWVMVAKDDAA